MYSSKFRGRIRAASGCCPGMSKRSMSFVLKKNTEDVKKISEKVAAAGIIAEKSVAESAGSKAKAVTGKDASTAADNTEGEPQTAFAKMKAFVRKAVDCCIE